MYQWRLAVCGFLLLLFSSSFSSSFFMEGFAAIHTISVKYEILSSFSLERYYTELVPIVWSLAEMVRNIPFILVRSQGKKSNLSPSFVGPLVELILWSAIFSCYVCQLFLGRGFTDSLTHTHTHTHTHARMHARKHTHTHTHTHTYTHTH